MPTTLNALIRYKTINSCLYGGKRKWSIEEIVDACSAALADARGRYDKISERTIRDDIRVMRSDILGFNAPIGQEKGLYFYTDPQYSIFTLTITDPELAARILAFLEKLRDQIQHPELESILELLGKLAVKPVVRKAIPEMKIDEGTILINRSAMLHTDLDFMEYMPVRQQSHKPKDVKPLAPIQKSAFSWRDVFEKILLLTS